MYCRHCGREATSGAAFCAGCGKRLVGEEGATRSAGVSPKSRLAAAILAWFVGWLGIHRFYLGKVGTGLLMIFTLGGLGVWALVDFVLIVVGDMTDGDGLLVSEWGIN